MKPKRVYWGELAVVALLFLANLAIYAVALAVLWLLLRGLL